MQKFLAAVETIAALFLLLIAVLIAGNVLLRNAFNITIPDWFDGARLLLGVAMFWGIAVATYHAGHICVDLLWEHVGERNKRRIDLFATAVVLAFLAPLAWMVWVKVRGTGTQGTSDLRLPLMWFYAVGAAGAGAAFVLALLRAWQLLRGHDPKLDVAGPVGGP